MANRFVPGFLGPDLVLVGLLGLWTTVSGFQGIPGSAGGVDGPLALLYSGVVLVAIGLPAVLFAPGYALVAALFPRGAFGLREAEAHRELTVGERLALAVGLSVCVVPLLGLALNFSPLLIEPATYLSVIGVTTVALTVVAAVRRQMTSPQERFEPALLARASEAVGSARMASGTTLLVVAGLVVVGASIGATAVTTNSGEEFTEFYLSTPGLEQPAGEGEAFTDQLALGESAEITVGITNQEGEDVTYTVVVLLQSLDGGEVQDEHRLDTLVVPVAQGETVEQRHTMTPVVAGENLRVTYLLFEGPVPSGTQPSESEAYRHVHIWVTVTE